MLSIRSGRRLFMLACCTPLLCNAQMSTHQKLDDFRQIVGLYEHSYAPAAWKKQVFGFDLFATEPWFDRVEKSTDDLEFYEICMEYVASLNDTHSHYDLASNWSANLGFAVDSYEGSILIDRIDRSRLPVGQFPFQLGDQLVSVDGIGVEDWIRRLSKWAPSSNPRSKRSVAAQAIVVRSQNGSPTTAAYPRAPTETGDTAVVTIRRQSGALEAYAIAWTKTGIPLVKVGPVRDRRSQSREMDLFSGRAATAQEGSLAPFIALPAGFQQRLGKPGDFFYSGTFAAGGLRIGYLRISQFVAATTPGGTQLPDSRGIAQLAPELAYLQANTDGLVVDIMHNGGGAVTYLDAIYSYLSPQPYQILRAVWRPTLAYLKQTGLQLQQAEASHADQQTLAFYQAQLEQGQVAYAKGAALTPPVPLLGTTALRQPATDAGGNILAYTKPTMLLTDDFTVSAADAFAALYQDNGRGIIFGIRTNGAGGNVAAQTIGAYSQGSTGLESNINIRNHTVNVPGYPPTQYFDSVGVQPDIVVDYMTKDNLLNQDATFSASMVAAMVDYLRKQAH